MSLMSEVMGIPVSAVKRIEDGGRRTTVEDLDALCTAYSIRPDQVMGYDVKAAADVLDMPSALSSGIPLPDGRTIVTVYHDGVVHLSIVDDGATVIYQTAI